MHGGLGRIRGRGTLAIGAQPTSTVAFDGSVTIFGSLAGGGGARRVTFEAKECGIYGSFHVVGGATTTAGVSNAVRT